MYQITEKSELSPGVKLFKVFAPLIARKCQPGQFVILRIDENGERIPLTIADFDRDRGTITLIFQEVGSTTRLLGLLEKGNNILDLAGPLGTATEIENYGTVVCVGGGIGVAPLYPIARAYKQAGNRVITIIGARSADLLILEDELTAISDELVITTDDGSKGIHGRVTNPLKDILKHKQIERVMAIGPVIMMKSVADVTKGYGVHTLVSLNPIMIDGTGMCGGCRVNVGNANKFACVDGPEFDAHLVDFDGLMTRQRMYYDYERGHKQYGGGCSCHQ